MATFTTTDLRGVILPGAGTGETLGPAQVVFKSAADYVGERDPAPGLVIQRPTTTLWVVISGEGFTYSPEEWSVGPHALPRTVTGTITGFTELDEQGRIIATVADLPRIALSGAVVNDLVGRLSSGDDDMTGSSFVDQLAGGEGADSIRGMGGNDTVQGGAGADDVNGNQDQDLVYGGAGSDTVRGGQGADSVYGQDGDDGHVNGNLGDDSVFGGGGNDTVYGGQGNDRVYGDETTAGASGDDLVSGDLGDDSVFGGLGRDTVLGGEGADLVAGDAGNDILWGGAGADRFAFSAGGGIDWVADFDAAAGDRIRLAVGTTYTLAEVGGQATINLGGGEFTGLAGVASTAFGGGWIEFV